MEEIKIMWEAIAKVLTNSNALLALVFLLIFFILFVLLARTGLVQINTNSFRMGADLRERDIIRQQKEWAHTYVMALEHDVEADNTKYNGYFTKYILEIIYDEIIDWITYNHINLQSDYIDIKQAKIKAIVYSCPVDKKYRTKEFEKKIDKWTEIVIRKLVLIREVYK